ncbi:hypothetical protein M2140_000433 [Clostridiales Family XIII bacterium PM5-7]
MATCNFVVVYPSLLSYNIPMNKLFISEKANDGLIKYLTEKGYQVEFIASDGIVDDAISHHPDIFLCKMGVDDNAPIFFAENQDLGKDYPKDIAFNAACTGKYFIHNLSNTNEKLLLAAKAMDMVLVDVNQGYTKCSTVVVDWNAIITYDEGIAQACEKFKGLDVLKVSPGHVHLDGYDTGFIGGASGRVGKEIIFNGDLSAHPDAQSIIDFIHGHSLACKWFPNYPLTDIGSIL